jgi:hypothetical protein
MVMPYLEGEFESAAYDVFHETSNPRPVTQAWTWRLPFMQQSVLLSALRGCDGLPKRHKAKPLLKWYRRCIVYSAFDGVALTNPFTPGGGSYTGPVAEISPICSYHVTSNEPLYLVNDGYANLYAWKCAQLQRVSDDFIDSRDELHGHYKEHCMHAFEVVGYKHPDETIREFWRGIYVRMVRALHLQPETALALDERLGDNEAGWRAHGDESTSCTD